MEVRRSKRRTRTVSAYRRDGRIIIAIPAHFSAAQERTWVATMLADLERKQRRKVRSEPQLEQRAQELNQRYLAGRARFTSVRWVSNQRGRWGSCTVATGAIRLSDRLATMPGWVVDYVLVHELAHTIEAGHGQAFWDLLAGYEHRDRARGFLEGVSFATDVEPGERG